MPEFHYRASYQRVADIVCDRCGSADLLQDAYVHVNDPSDVRTFDYIVCNSCGNDCNQIDVEVPNTFNIYVDKVLL